MNYSERAQGCSRVEAMLASDLDAKVVAGDPCCRIETLYGELKLLLNCGEQIYFVPLQWGSPKIHGFLQPGGFTQFGIGGCAPRCQKSGVRSLRSLQLRGKARGGGISEDSTGLG
jgi:hypothetical protein